ncbi:MAG: twin-arginine translocation signal domain-containing protein, partial [Desulfobacterales bacterium]|nr:twin-arginine translocation signal domain-containing protein [Desulfobacterales bacterium]
MAVKSKGRISRRGFMQLSGAAAACAACGGPARVLHALVSTGKTPETEGPSSMFSACDMCFNKCGLIARVEKGVVKKLDPNPKSLKSRG